MSLILRRKAGGPGVVLLDGLMKVRVVTVDPDGTVHLAFNGDRSINIMREETVPVTSKPKGDSNV